MTVPDRPGEQQGALGELTEAAAVPTVVDEQGYAPGESTLTPVADGATPVTVSTSGELDDALAQARPGTTIVLADGVYTSTHPFTITTACTAAEPCTLRGGAAAVVEGGGPDGHYALHLDGADHWALTGFSVRAASKGVMLDGTAHTVLDGLDVSQIGAEAIHLRSSSSDNVVRGCSVHDTGLVAPQYGEGIYVGSAVSNWDRYSGGAPDASDRNELIGNHVWATGAENIDIKEGTTGGVLRDNVFDGTGMSGLNGADSWVDVKGNAWTIAGNDGTHALRDGFQTHVAAPGWGERNVFTGNHAQVDATGYGFRIQDASSTGNVVRCDNVVTGAEAGTSNQACS
ncbi:right-handed parallel beta-helix repeat-containing protein [Isoptericola sp. b490]|uniref:right-handed parallel beta-helix repeat-containing protein n=1 Tax=Actinotalea lenta TaxID=3064654 RepID=UPI002712247D|nr:right-handed parallel beta-helix repeat-containing protein [Isoptericola sp. b490]MDO8120261.1 right-handed parallel beta-helix repeat-containing protein [Isoptericola sp. b490]